jgi:SAM-dependent methyltransferase
VIFDYKGRTYPTYLRDGNACQAIAPIALHFCVGNGLDVGAGRWPLPGAQPVELKSGGDAMELPHGQWDYIFSSHCLEHLANPIAALRHWQKRLRVGGVLFLYLPHPDMEYWLPQNNAKHLHSWSPASAAKIVIDLGFVNVLHSERDMAWGFSVVGWKA